VARILSVGSVVGSVLTALAPKPVRKVIGWIVPKIAFWRWGRKK
jgi:hypothetical protein